MFSPLNWRLSGIAFIIVIKFGRCNIVTRNLETWIYVQGVCYLFLAAPRGPSSSMPTLAID